MKKELKKQIKEDEIKSGAEGAWRWLQANRTQVRTMALAGGAAALLILGIMYFRGNRERSAVAAFDEAMKIYETPVSSEGAPSPGAAGVTPFKSAAEKYTKAAAAFDGVERGYPTLTAGVRARYYGALCRIELGSYAEAKKALGAIVATREPGSLEAILARLALADADRRMGAVDKAIEAYRAMAEDQSSGIPRDYALMSLAGTLEDARRTDEARASYRRLAEQFPDSVFAQEARRRASYLATSAQG